MKFSKALGFALSLLLLATTLMAWTTWAPGFSYDEAWLGLQAHRIALEPGYWPWLGMSHYTIIVCQYITALAFKLFGTSISVYRTLANFEILVGVSLIAAAFAIAGEALASLLFPAVITLFPALIMHFRWSVELSTFSVFCTGLVALGLAKRWKQGSSPLPSSLILCGIVLGVSSHLILYAPAFALWYCLYVSGYLAERKDKILTTVILVIIFILILFIFFFAVKQPQLFALATLTFILAIKTWVPYPQKWRKLALYLPAILGSLLLIPFSIYLEGSWLAKQFTGTIQNPYWIGSTFFSVLVLFLCLKATGWKIRKIPFVSLVYVPLTLLGIYAMAPKVGARYLTVPFLYVAGATSLALTRIPFKQRCVIGLLWFFFSFAQLWQNYFKPSLEERQVAITFRLGRLMREYSGDFFPKNGLVQRLAKEGCTWSDIRPESRWYEMEFMTYGDWPKVTDGPCHFGHSIELQRKDDFVPGSIPSDQVFPQDPYMIKKGL